MVVYVRIEPNEEQSARKGIASVKEKFNRVNKTALKFDVARNEEKRVSAGVITRVRAIEKEIANLKALMPKLETVKAKEKILETKGRAIKEKPLGKVEKTKYQEELENIRKKIAELR